MKAPVTISLLSALLAAAAQAAPVGAPLPPVEAGAVPAGKVPEPQVLHEVAEDDHVRIEEIRVRGQTQRLTVQPKIPGMPAYDIVPPQGGRAPEDDKRAGQRIWLKMNF